MRNSLFLTLGVCLFLMVSGCRQAASESPRVPERPRVIVTTDGDALTVRWWQYTEAGTCPKQAAIESPGAPETRITVPADAPAGTTLHFICEVTDDGEPALTRYARTILTVK